MRDPAQTDGFAPGALARGLLKDGSLVRVVDRLGDVLSCHVSILDATLQLVACSSRVKEEDLQVWLDFRAPATPLRGSPARTMFTIAGPEGSRAVVLSITGESGFLGYLLLWPLTASAANVHKDTIQDAAGVIGLDLARRRMARRMEYRYQQDAIHELLSGRITAVADLERREAHLPWNLHARYRAILVQLAPLLDGGRDEEFMLSLVESVSRSLKGVMPSAIVTTIDSMLTLLIPEDGLMAQETDLELVARGVQHTLLSDSEKLNVGVSERAVPLLEVGTVYEEARDALELGRTLKGPGAISHFANLGIYRLLRSAPYQLQKEFCDAIIRPIEEHDRERNAPLMETLREYMAADGRVKLAAERLFVHVNTVKYRLRQIEELTGHSPYTVDGQLHLLLALKLKQLLARA